MFKAEFMLFFKFIVTISNLSLLSGLIINFLIGLPKVILVNVWNKKYVFYIINTLKVLLLTLIVTNYIISYKNENISFFSIVYYFIGYYIFYVVFTLIDQTEKEELMNMDMGILDINRNNVYNYNPYNIIISVFCFILAIIFPTLTGFYLPDLFLKTYTWLFGFKFIGIPLFLNGIVVLLYVIQHAILSILHLIKVL